MDNTAHINVLNGLVEICRDGNRGYKAASDHIEHDELKTVLYRLAQQRALFEEEIKNEIRVLGGTPNEFGTLTGDVHRTWLDVKAMFKGNDTRSILESCKTGDSAAVEAYEKALKAPLPEYIKEMLMNQFKLIKGAIVQLNEFEEHPS
jgi:uncharacterized protein (TIGR02284 family)